MVGVQSDALFTLDPNTAKATRVGSLSAFGVGETSPIGLASHNGNLYMVGWQNDVLYTINLSGPRIEWSTSDSPGRASRVTTESQLGIGETSPLGLASHNGNLYMVGTVTDALYTLDIPSGVANRVGNSFRFGVNESSPTSLASHNGTLYMVGGSTDALYTVNTSTGAATRVGSSTQFSVSEGSPSGLTSHNGILYLLGSDEDAFFILNTTTGSATQVGMAERFGIAQQNPTGIASHEGTLYMIANEILPGSFRGAAIYSLNATNGVATRIGHIVNFGLPYEFFPHGLASHNDQLYLFEIFQANLYTVTV